MAHLIIDQGKGAGKEITVPADGLKFGRSPVNDIVLKSSKVMLFHGRFFFKSDDSLWVTDFGAAEKTTVDGVAIDEQQLTIGDLVKVGDTVFRVLDAGTAKVAVKTMSPAAPVGGGEGSAPTEEIDLGFKHEEKPQSVAVPQSSSKSSLTTRLIQVVVILLVLAVLMVVGPSLYEMTQKESQLVVVQKESLTLAYERVVGNSRNIFRYYLELDADGRFSVQIDDLKHNRHTSREKSIDETLLLQLSNSINEAGFFDLGAGASGDVPGRYDLYDIAIQRNGRFHHVRQVNRSLPSELKRTVELVEEFASQELGISFTWNLSSEKLLELAEDAFELAESHYAARNVSYENLAMATKYYGEVQLYLETMEPKPEIYGMASDGMRRATEEQNLRYEDYIFRANKAIRLSDWEKAQESLRIILELIPDRSDERHQNANSKLLTVEQHLK